MNIEAGQGRAQQLEPAFALCHRIGSMEGESSIVIYNNRIYNIYKADRQALPRPCHPDSDGVGEIFILYECDGLYYNNIDYI